jgi:hypothetical protein
VQVSYMRVPATPSPAYRAARGASCRWCLCTAIAGRRAQLNVVLKASPA